MQSLTLTPLFRESVGFDRFNDLFESVLNSKAATNNPGYPPYNIEKRAENRYRITMAVAGFSIDDLAITVEDDVLTIAGENKTAKEEEVQYLHKGIAERAFHRKFSLSDYMKVKDANLANGLLKIDLEREIPESSKPKTIKIRSDAQANAKLVENANDKKKV